MSLGVVIAAVLVPAVTMAQTAILDRILAIVDGQIIMHSDVRAFIDLGLVDIPAGPSQEAEVLTWLIERQVVIEEQVDQLRDDRCQLVEVAARYADRADGFDACCQGGRQGQSDEGVEIPMWP